MPVAEVQTEDEYTSRPWMMSSRIWEGIDKTTEDLNETIEEGKKRNFDNFKDIEQAKLISLRADLLNAMFQANTIKNKIQNIFKKHWRRNW